MKKRLKSPGHVEQDAQVKVCLRQAQIVDLYSLGNKHDCGDKGNEQLISRLAIDDSH